MSLRGRLVVLCAAAVSVAVLAACVVAYLATSHELHDQVDTPLRDQAALARRLPARLTDDRLRRLAPPLPRGVRPFAFPAPPSRRGGTAGFIQLVRRTGPPSAVGPFAARLPVDARVREVAAGTRGTYVTDVHVRGEHLRMIVAPLGGGRAVQLARSLSSTDRVLRRLRIVLVLVALAGVALAALLGWLIARRALRPIADLTAAADRVEATGDLDLRVGDLGSDEVGRLAGRLDEMLDRIAASRAAQRRLVADASHELRTPVTSLRTNAEVLRELLPRGDARLDAPLDAVVGQAEELGRLIGDVVELARDDTPAARLEDVRLDELVEACVQRARGNHPATTFTEQLAELTVSGAPDRLERAVNNLLDNAATHGDGGPVEVIVDADGLTVRDHGRGLAPEERDHVFERFFRGADSRDTPGSGLGLAIVRQVAETHGAAATAEDTPGGGATFRLRFPR